MIPGTRVDHATGLITWIRRPAGLAVSFADGIVTVATATGGGEQSPVIWESNSAGAQRLAWAIRAQRPATVPGHGGSQAVTRKPRATSGMWLALAAGGDSTVVPVPDCHLAALADAISQAAVIAQIRQASERPEWAVVHKSVSQALQALLDLGLGPDYLRSVLP